MCVTTPWLILTAMIGVVAVVAGVNIYRRRSGTPADWQRQAPCENPDASSYKVVRENGLNVAVFSPCGVRSWHPLDLQYGYCARCHRFVKPRSQVEHAWE